MRTYELHLCQNEECCRISSKEKADKIMDYCFNSNKQAICYALDKLLEAPKKYKYAVLFDNKGKKLISIQR